MPRPSAFIDLDTRHNVNLRPRILLATDRVMAAAVVALVFGSAVCFGGAVWWFRAAVAVVTFVLVGTKLTQHLLERAGARFEEPALPARAAGAGAGALAACPVTAALAAQTLAGLRSEIYSLGTIPGAGPSRPALGPARRAGRRSLAGDA